MFALIIISSSLVKIAGWKIYIVNFVISLILPAVSLEAFIKKASATLNELPQGC
jgi:uncharacterized membrane protein